MQPNADKTSLLQAFPLTFARLDEYFGAWAIEERRGALLEQTIAAADMAEHVRQYAEERKKKADAKGSKQAFGDGYGSSGYQLAGGVAIIQLEGTLMKQESSFGGTSTVAARRQIKQALADPKVGGLLLVWDSPGGTSAGAGDLAETIAEATTKKPTWSYAEDCCCSAAYFGASQAEKVYANAGATVGSIGTYMVVRDLSGAYQKSGVKTYVVRAGEHKGAGTPGTEITAEQLAVMQDYVNEVNKPFVAAVARGRKLSSEQAATLADGKVYVGPAAIEKKLIDGVQSLDQTLSDLQKVIQQQSGRKTSMSEENKPKAATTAELRAACKGASSDFILAQIEKGATVQEALTAFVAEQSAQLETEKAAKLKAEKERDEAKQADATPKPGVKPLKEKPKQTGGEEASGEPLEEFEKLVQRHVSAGMKRHDAVAKVCREHEDLRQAYVEAHNEAHPHHSR